MSKSKMMKRIACIVLAGACAFPVACDEGKRGVVEDEKTMNIAIAQAGYGVNWLREIADKFEALYEEEGYKINILDPQAGLTGATALSELRLGSATGVDMYFTAAVYPSDIVNEDFGVCAETLDDVYSKGAINFDGSVDEVTIENKMMDNLKGYLMAEDGHYYDYYYYVAPCGIVTNTKVLENYGITELPRTTDELFEVYDKIYFGTNGKPGSLSSKVYPTTWGGSNAYGYPLQALYTYLCQIMGTEAYEEFFALDSLLDGNKIDPNGYQIYENEDIRDVMEAWIQQYDIMYSYPGSQGQRHDDAHAQVMRGLAAFMSDGEFFYNEVKLSFSSALDNITMLRQPVLSALGTKLKLDGTGTDAEKCDDILSYMVGLVDEDKTVEQIASAASAQFGVTVSKEQAQRVHDARRVMFKQTQSDTYIVKNSPMKEQAKLFLRMLASEDAAKIMSKYAMGSAYSPAEVLDDDPRFIKSAKEILNSHTHSVSLLTYIGSVRKKTNLYILPGYDASIVLKIMSDIGVEKEGVAARNYYKLADSVYKYVKSDAQTNWVKYMTRGGYVVE